MPAPDFSIRLGLVGASTVMTGIQSLITVAGQLISKVRELAEAADAYGDVVNGHAVSVQQAQIATGHLIDTITLHQQAARLEAAGLEITAQQFRALSVAATDYAQRTGGDVTESFETLTEAVMRGSQRGLRPYGIELQRTGTLEERRLAVVRQLTDAHGDQTLEVEGTADAFAALENVATTAFNEMLLAAERNAGPLQTLLRGITSAVTDVANALEAQRRAQARIARMGTVAEQLEIQRDLNRAGYTASGARDAGFMSAVARGARNFALMGTMNPDDWARQQAARLETLQQTDILNIQLGNEPVIAPEPSRPPRPGDTGGGGGRNGRDAEVRRVGEEMMRQIAAAEEEAQAASDRLAEIYREQASDLADFWTELGDLQMEQTQIAIDKQIEAQAAVTEAANAAWEAMIDGAQRETEARQELLEKTQSYAQSIYGVYQTLTGAVGDFAVGLADSAEEEKRIRGAVYMAEQVGALLLAITMEALYIAQNNVEGAIAAGAAIVAAGIGIAKTAVEFGTSSKSGTTGGSSRASSSGSAAATSMSGGRQGNVTVYFTGPVTSRRAHEEVVALEREGARGY